MLFFLVQCNFFSYTMLTKNMLLCHYMHIHIMLTHGKKIYVGPTHFMYYTWIWTNFNRNFSLKMQIFTCLFATILCSIAKNQQHNVHFVVEQSMVRQQILPSVYSNDKSMKLKISFTYEAYTSCKFLHIKISNCDCNFKICTLYRIF
jgi:hypothetical protein